LTLKKQVQLEPAIEKEPASVSAKITSFGPGIVAVLAWLGAGDLVSASVSGAQYGYALMWMLALSLLIRFVLVNIMARFQLCNLEGLSLLEGYARVHKFFPLFLGVSALLVGHLIGASMIKGTGEALADLLRVGSPFLWSVVTVLSALFILGRNVYNKIENVMKLLLAIMTFSFVLLAIYSSPDVGQIVKGTVGFSMPDDIGAHGALLVGLSLVGAVAGSITNFLYGYFIKDKGWVGPAYKKLQRNDLLFAICMAIVIDLSIWVVGAEILRPNNIEINSVSDLSQALSIHLGQSGYIIFYLGVLGALYSSVVGLANGMAKLSIDCFQNVKIERKQKYGETLESDPWFKWITLWMLVSPLVWSLPSMPGFVALVLGVNALYVVLFPAIAIGLIILSNSKKLLGNHTNNLFENVVLVFCTGLALWSSTALAIQMFS
jgi:Mn2+/Fe2+ NRAMP family transporter